MINLKYIVKLINPSLDNLFITDDIKNKSSLTATVNSTGLTITGDYYKNDKYYKASSQLALGEEYSVNTGEDLSLGVTAESYLDVEQVLQCHGKKSYECDPTILSHMNILSFENNDIYKMNHVIQSREDIVLFKLQADGSFKIVDCIFNGPSHLLQLIEPIQPIESFVYFIVGKSLQVGLGNALHIPTKDLIRLPEGFCTIKNRLVTKNNIKFLTNETTTLLQTDNPENVVFSYPLNVDGLELLSYKTHARETIMLSPSQAVLSLEHLVKYTGNLTVIYKLTTTGDKKPALCLLDETLENLLNGHVIEYNDNEDALSLLSIQTEFKKNYVYEQYLIEVDVNANKYFIENRQILTDLLNNIKKFSNKIVKI